MEGHGVLVGRPLGVDGLGPDAGNGVRGLLEGPVQIPAAEIEAVPGHGGKLNHIFNGIGLGNLGQLVNGQVLIGEFISDRRPDRVQRHHILIGRGQGHTLLAVGVFRGAAVRIGCPALEGVARPGEGVGGQGVGLAAEHGLGLHGALVRAVALIDHSVAVGGPLGIQGHRRAGLGRQIHHLRAVGVGSLASGGRGPARKPVALPGKAELRQFSRLVIGHGNRLHGALAAVWLERHRIGDGRPLGSQFHGALFGQLGNRLLVLIGVPLRIRPTGKDIARAGKGVGSQRSLGIVDKGLILHLPGAAVGVKVNGVGIDLPLGIEGDFRSLARGDGIHDLPASLIQTPAQETEAGLPGRLQDQRLIGAPSGGIGVLDALHVFIGQNISTGHTVHDLLCRGGPLTLFIQEELAAGIALPVLKPAVFLLGRGLCGVMGQNMTGNPRHFAPNGGPAVAAGGLRRPIAGVDTDDVVFQAHESIRFELGQILAGEDDGWVLIPRIVHLAESLVSDVGHRGGQTNAFHRLVVPEEALRNVRDSLRKFNMIDKFAGKAIAAKLRDGILNDHVLNADPEGQLLLGVIRHFSGTCQRQGTDPQGTDSALGDPEGRGHGQRVQITAGPDGRFSKGDLIGEDRQLFQISAPAERVAANRFHIGAERQFFQPGIGEGVILNGFQGIRECNGFQALAAVEGVLPDFLQGIAKGNFLQVFAAAEGVFLDLFQRGRELYAFERFTAMEHSLGELCDFIGQSDTLQRIAAVKRPVFYLLNGIGEDNTFRIG